MKKSIIVVGGCCTESLLKAIERINEECDCSVLDIHDSEIKGPTRTSTELEQLSQEVKTLSSEQFVLNEIQREEIFVEKKLHPKHQRQNKYRHK